MVITVLQISRARNHSAKGVQAGTDIGESYYQQMQCAAEIVEGLTNEMRKLDPVWCIARGIAVDDETTLTDLSLQGIATLTDVYKRYEKQLQHAVIGNRKDQLVQKFVLNRLRMRIADGMTDPLRLGGYDSPLFEMMLAFRRMSLTSTETPEVFSRRLSAVPVAIAGLRETLLDVLETDYCPSQLQIQVFEDQVRGWASFDIPFVGTMPDEPGGALQNASLHARAALLSLADFLRDDVTKRVEGISCAVGESRYREALFRHLGMSIDPLEAYAWGWEQLSATNQQIKAVCGRIAPGLTTSEVIKRLDQTGAKVPLVQLGDWLQNYMRTVTDRLDGKLYVVPTEHQPVTVRVTTPVGMPLYRRPSANFSTPGLVEWPAPLQDPVPIWKLLTTAHHEGVGHDAQAALAMHAGEFPDCCSLDFIGGLNEGWAVYLEAVIRKGRFDENDLVSDDELQLSFLLMELLLYTRVVLDIGLHLGLQLPEDFDCHPGEKWTLEIAEEVLVGLAMKPAKLAASEVRRYACWPAQAISYALGRRAIEDARRDAAGRLGDQFDLREFHHELLMGPIVLDSVL